MRVSIATSWLWVALLGACSLTRSLGDLSSGSVENDISNSKDSGFDSADGAPLDTGVLPDGNPADTGALPDGNPDTGASSSFCDNQNPAPKFCVDFDDRTVVLPTTDRDFQILAQGGSAKSTIDDGTFGFLAPSLKFSAVATDTAWVRREYADAPRHIVYSMAMRADSFSDDVDTMEVRLGAPDVSVFVKLAGGTTPVVWVASAGAGASSYASAVTVASGEWHRYEVVIDLPTSTVEASIDGAKVMSTTTALPATIGAGVVLIGGYTTAQSFGTLWIDDVIAIF